MHNRFEHKKCISVSGIIMVMTFFAFTLFFILFYRGVSSVSDTTYEKQYESLESALQRSISQCYAVEGTYPPNLEYIISNYGLIYDETLFYIDYRPIGSNIMPDVTIIKKAGGSQ